MKLAVIKAHSFN